MPRINSPLVTVTHELLVIAIVIFSMTSSAYAGSFSVSPVRIYMMPRDRAIAITITNEGDAPVALQADIYLWSQKPDGTDELELTEEMILAPPIIKLAPQARQVVRLALLKPADASRQLTYRLIVREIPEATAAKGNQLEVPIVLALSMPIFITPPITKREMNCELNQAPRESPVLIVTCANIGSSYAQIREILLQRNPAAGTPASPAASPNAPKDADRGPDIEPHLARFEGGAYILPGSRKNISLSLAEPISPATPAAAKLAAGEATLKVTFDDGQQQSFIVRLP